MKKYILYILLNILLIPVSNGQDSKTITKDNQIWLSYSSQIRTSAKWGLWLDLSYRRKEDFISQPFQAVVRPGVTYFLNDDFRLSAGYAYFNHYPAGAREISQPEHRIWQQLQWSQKLRLFSLRHAIRLEQRFRRKYLDNEHLATDYNYNNRIRYNFTFLVPLNKREITEKTVFLSLNDEILVNFGKQIVYNYFDQNRLGVGLGYQADKSIMVQIGYMNVFQQLASGSSFQQNHVLRMILSYNFHL